jgi:hypothetical protein
MLYVPLRIQVDWNFMASKLKLWAENEFGSGARFGFIVAAPKPPNMGELAGPSQQQQRQQQNQEEHSFSAHSTLDPGIKIYGSGHMFDAALASRVGAEYVALEHARHQSQQPTRRISRPMDPQVNHDDLESQHPSPQLHLSLDQHQHQHQQQRQQQHIFHDTPQQQTQTQQHDFNFHSSHLNIADSNGLSTSTDDIGDLRSPSPSRSSHSARNTSDSPAQNVHGDLNGVHVVADGAGQFPERRGKKRRMSSTQCPTCGILQGPGKMHREACAFAFARKYKGPGESSARSGAKSKTNVRVVRLCLACACCWPSPCRVVFQCRIKMRLD